MLVAIIISTYNLIKTENQYVENTRMQKDEIDEDIYEGEYKMSMLSKLKRKCLRYADVDECNNMPVDKDIFRKLIAILQMYV